MDKFGLNSERNSRDDLIVIRDSAFDEPATHETVVI